MFRFLTITILLLSLSACGSSPKTHYYSLTKKITADMNSNPQGPSIGVWQVTLPSLLDRPEMITRNGEYGIEIADFHRWAGGLSSNITQLIASELNQKLNSNRVVVSPWLSYIKHDYQIRVQINRLEGELGKEMLLSGVWILLDTKGQKELLREDFQFTSTTTGNEYSGMAAAYNNLVVQLAAKVAGTIAAQ